MEEQESQRDYLHRQIAERLRSLDASIVWYRRTHFQSLMTTVVLSASITIIAGLKSSQQFSALASDLVLILGALVTVLSAWGAFSSPRESWHLNTATYSHLRSLQTKLEFIERGQNFEQDAAKILTDSFAEYQQILNEHNEEWQKLRSKTK